MLPILLYTTVFFWLIAMLQASLAPFRLADLLYVGLFAWSLYFVKNIEKYRFNSWTYWIPPIFGLGIASFLFFSPWIILPYLVAASVLIFLIVRKNKWMFRFKEGMFYCLIVFLFFLLAVSIIRIKIIDYPLNFDFYLRYFITFILSFGVWAYFMVTSRGMKIR